MKNLFYDNFFKSIESSQKDIVIYGYGKLGEYLYEKYKSTKKIIYIFDKKFNNKRDNQFLNFNLEVDLSKYLIVNTILNPIEAYKINNKILSTQKNLKILTASEYYRHITPYLEEQKILTLKDYLLKEGWIKSYLTQESVNINAEPIPWVTYPFIDFIQERLQKNFKIFEFGSGNSTIYYSKFVKQVTSVEHDKKFFNYINNQHIDNVRIFLKKLEYGGDYSQFIKTVDEKFHMVIVDGRDRVNCIKESLNNLLEDGIIVLDDSERKAYQEGVEFLLKKGFKQIDFWGIAPGINYKKSTAIFYRTTNCLNI